MSANLLAIITELAKVRQLNQEQLREVIIDSLYNALSKKLKPENELEVIADFNSNYLGIKFKKIVVENDESFAQISLAEAQQHDHNAYLGQLIDSELPINALEPKLVKIAREEISFKIKRLEEDRKMFDYEKQKNQIVYGKIKKNEYNGYIVDIGFADALLPQEEQIDEEFYKVGDNIRAYVLSVRKRANEVTVILSRAHPEFVKRLLELEVPEVHTGEIEIKKIIREPGIRTKVAVYTKRPNLDPVGACLGPKGIRVDAIKKELHGEAIDILEWDDDPKVLIANAIGPELVNKVYITEKGRFSRIIVSEENKNLAIGKLGKNVRLAARLTDYKIDIYTQDEFEDKLAEERRITSHISELDGVSAKIAEILKEHGYTSVQD
ncbi:MAG TPA: transcription termination factor NusA, partial [Candidatus Cloacimonadota bacterium]|nr:transcription termination factor NusA [Candidatus Cloacimonadota bacterium]